MKRPDTTALGGATTAVARYATALAGATTAVARCGEAGEIAA